ncbi:protein DPCD [Anopheles ziemanni]|uniref:protein DPCD n=1 Tax=Anopheles coustani TaxID=139045 RepID=UPI00265A3335|nr:protein DPCD [Anopheles coustani]XP_058166401.1 protein DPCD [Anopheles ziemanni]
MSFASWIVLIKSAEKTSAVQGNIRKVHYRFLDGREMVEEYSMDTGVILRRAWKTKSELMRKDEWQIELGDPIPVGLKENELVVKESSSEPILSKRLTRNAIEWRIRNLPYPLSTYSITCDLNEKTITVRTSNKKYFKKILVPEFQRCNYAPQQEEITTKHQNSTLIILYKKPKILLEMEKAVLEELQSVDTMEYDNFRCEELLADLMTE